MHNLPPDRPVRTHVTSTPVPRKSVRALAIASLSGHDYERGRRVAVGVFADNWCPVAHVGLNAVVAVRARLARSNVAPTSKPGRSCSQKIDGSTRPRRHQ